MKCSRAYGGVALTAGLVVNRGVFLNNSAVAHRPNASMVEHPKPFGSRGGIVCAMHNMMHSAAFGFDQCFDSVSAFLLEDAVCKYNQAQQGGIAYLDGAHCDASLVIQRGVLESNIATGSGAVASAISGSFF